MLTRKFGIAIMAAVLVLILGYTRYCLLAQKEISDGKTAFNAAEWPIAFQHFERATNFYRFSLPFNKVEIERLKDESSLLINGQNMRDQGNFTAALENYDAFIHLYPESAQELKVKQTSAQIYAEWVLKLQDDGQYDTALEKSNELLTLYPEADAAIAVQDSMPTFYLEWASALRKNGQFDEAILKYEYVLKEFAQTHHAETASSALSDTYLEWGQKLVNAENYELAVEKYSILQKKFSGQALSQNPENLLGETYLQWAEQLRHDSKPELALNNYYLILKNLNDTSAAVKATSALAPTTLEWALALQKEKKFAKEIELLTKLISDYEKTPESNQARQMLIPTYDSYGQHLIVFKNFLVAMQTYQDARAFAPDKETQAIVDTGYKMAMDGLIKDTGRDGQAVIDKAWLTACRGKPVASPAVGAAKKEPAKGLVCGFLFSLPPEWRATTPGNFRYVIEITKTTTPIQTCPYGNGRYYLVRDRQNATVVVRNTLTGKVSMSTTLSGSPPQSCSYRYSFGSTTEHVVGGPVDDQAIISWLNAIFR